MKPHVLITLIFSGLFFSPLYAETSFDAACNDSKNIAPFSKSYSYSASSPINIQLPGFSLFADSGSLKHSLDIVVTRLPHKAGVAMPSNMDNVSGAGDGIQLLPNGVHFSDSAPALISLAYDPARIPMGYKPKDVYTYYCDDARTWHRLVRVSIDTTLHIVTSYTTHFTDFANAVIKVPEMPESKAFVPTDMQDLPDPDPLTGIPMIAVPQANNMGTAELTYPVQLPPGRHGLQPDLNLHYSSAGGNGLLGVGWSIAQPAVTIDTRWGVPRYDLRYETEAYLINGEPFMMHDEDDIPIPLPHMASSFVPRGTRATRFYARDRRNQAKAVRHGQAPDRYWWSVTTTDGVTYYYGYDPYALTIDESSVLRTDSGNIGYWALTYVVDRFDNYIRYVNNKYSGNEIVIQRIEYTGNHLQGLSPFYSIGFSYKLRPDEQLDARLGLLRNQKHVLCQIYVQIGSNYTPITSYRLYYEEGAFSLYKSRLSSIAKVDGGFLYLNECDIPIQEAQLILSDEGWIDEENSFFNNITHEEARTEQKPACLTQFAYADACASTELYKPAETLIPSTANFSASRTEGWNIGGTAAIGVGFNPSMTTFSAGANYSYSRSQGGVETMMIDLNGDGLLDRLHVSNTLVYYERQRNSGSFASPVLIQGLDRLSRVDPDGNRIIVVPSLTNPDFYSKALGQLEELKQMDPELNKMITGLEMSLIDFFVTYDNKINHYSRKEKTIGYDPYNDRRIDGKVRPTEAVLAHELGHAENDKKGTAVNYDSKMANGNIGTPKEQAIEQEKRDKNEANPIYYENIVREEKGFPQRGYNYSAGD